jgi:hypothetical protein
VTWHKADEPVDEEENTERECRNERQHLLVRGDPDPRVRHQIVRTRSENQIEGDGNPHPDPEGNSRRETLQPREQRLGPRRAASFRRLVRWPPANRDYEQRHSGRELDVRGCGAVLTLRKRRADEERAEKGDRLAE